MTYSTIIASQKMQVVEFGDLAIGDCFYDPTNQVCRKTATDAYQAQDGNIVSAVASTEPVSVIDVEFAWNYAL